MNFYVLLTLYTLLLPISGIRLYLLHREMDLFISWADLGNLTNRLLRLKVLQVRWHIWLFREVKDWVLAGVLGFLMLTWLQMVLPGVNLWVGTLLVLVLAVDAVLAMVLWIFIDQDRIWASAVRLAIRFTLPDYVLANRRRAGSWGIIFVLCGFAGFAAWFSAAKGITLLWGFILITLGFVSLLKAANFSFNKENREAQHAENIG